MNHHKSREVVLAIDVTDELLQALDKLRESWRSNPASVPKGVSCTESKEGQFALMAAESAFVTLPGAYVISGIGAVALVGLDPVFEEGASSKTLVLKGTSDGWKFSVKYVPPIVRKRNTK